jgi:hypothetical protein
MKLEFHPEAEEEFLEAVSYYEAQYIVAVAHERRKPGYWETR